MLRAFVTGILFMSESVPIVLVDGSSYLYRAFHALPPLATSTGMQTGAVKGVLNMLRSLQKDFPGSDVVVVFDAKGKTFRDDLYPEYKATRPPMPDDLREQIAPLHKAVEALGFPMLIIPGVEADDVIGTLAAQASSQGVQVVISTGDKDMAQLVNENVILLDTMKKKAGEKGTLMDVKGVIEKFGVRPDQIIDYLALMGDKVDNIPGVEKCGPKTAVKWLEAYESLDGVIAHAEEVKGKVGENLRSALEDLPLSYQLATIKKDCELEFGLADLKQRQPNKEVLLELFSELEFKSWVREFESMSDDSSAAVEAPKIETDYALVLNEGELNSWVEKLKGAALFAFDTETTSLNYIDARVVGVSFSCEPGKAAYVPFGHDYIGAPEQLSEEQVLGALKPLLEDPEIAKLGQNLKYDKSVLANHGIDMQGIRHDTMLESYVLNPTSNRHDMDTLAEKHLAHSTIHFEDIAGKGKKQLTFNQIALEQAGPYAAEDADITLRLHEVLSSEFESDSALSDVYQRIELPLLNVLSRTERNGALIDTEQLAQQSAEHGETLERLEKEAFDLAGEEFNLASTKQLGKILFEKLEIPVIKKTKTGAPSTAEEVLQELAHDYPLPAIILEYRGIAKLKSTYTDKLPQLVNAATGRVHTSYHQAVTATGRLSSSDPNLQNIPIKTEAGRRVRQAFVAPEGYRLLAADYSQIELRIMAHLSGDEGLQQAFAQGLDIHKATAAEVFAVDLDAVSSEQRRSAKAINFGLIYGMSAFGLAKQLHIGRNDAQRYIDTYFARYPGVAEYMKRVKAAAAETGYVETLLGRRLYLPDIRSSNGARRQAAERIAINAPMQGTAADIIKLAMIEVDRWLSEEQVDAKLIMQVHDELVLEVAEADIERVQASVVARMEQAMALSVPLLVEVGVGENWDQAH
jgi:DNA polymerase-1